METILFTRTVLSRWPMRLGKSLLWMLAGLLAFLFSFVLLWMGEGIPSFGAVASAARVVEPGGTLPRNAGPVLITGALQATVPAETDPLLVTMEPSVAWARVVETWAWQEIHTQTSRIRWGGSEETEHTWRYEQGWTAQVPDSATFQEPMGHDNPAPRFPGEVRIAPSIAVAGASLAELPASLPGAGRWTPAASALGEALAGGIRTETWVYLPGVDPENPQVGDTRVGWYRIAPGLTVTVLGALKDGRLVRHLEDRFPMYDVVAGDREAALEVWRTEDVIRRWAMRVVGLLLMWGGLFLLASPLWTFWDFAPPAGIFVRILVALTALLPTALLGSVTIGLAILGHNAWWTAGILASGLLLVLGLYYVWPRLRPGSAPRWMRRG
jgi:hypothetical protein